MYVVSIRKYTRDAGISQLVNLHFALEDNLWKRSI